MTTITGQQNVGEFQLAAICYDPGLLSSSSGYANLSYVNELLALKEGEYKTLGLYLPEMDRMDLDAAKLYEVLKGKGVQLFDRGDKGTDANPVVAMMKQASDEKWEGIKFRLYTLNDLLAEVQQIVNVLNVASLVILLILFVIIMVGVTNTFRMVMYERTREIGTMRAIGMQKKEVKRLFLFEALFIALGGSLAGYILSGIIMFVLSRIYWGMDSAVFILLKNGYMTFSMQGWQVVVNVLLVSILTVLAAFFPARKAAALRPADALRSQK
jgi:putative ABC transport system permease protein